MVDGVRVPSVTEVLGITGLSDFSGIPYAILEHARQRGSEVHDWCDMLDKGLLSPNDTPDSEIEGYVAAYLRFKDEAGFEVIESEFKVLNIRYRYAGTLDRIAYMRTRPNSHIPHVIDLKCVALVSAATPIQITGYVEALPGINGGASLQLKHDGSYKLKHCLGAQVKHDWYAVLRMCHWKLNNGLAKLEN